MISVGVDPTSAGDEGGRDGSKGAAPAGWVPSWLHGHQLREKSSEEGRFSMAFIG